MKPHYETVVITGGSEGIGLATGRGFAPRCRRLVLLARNPGRLASAAASVEQESPNVRVLTMACDVADAEAVRRAFREIAASASGIDVLVNNAGGSVYGPAEQTPMQAIRDVMAVNYFGAVHCMLSVLPIMRARGRGTIVNISSTAALHGVPYLSAYGAAKAALAAFCQSLRAEVNGTGIRVLLIYPGYTQTGLFAKEPVYGDAHRPRGPYAPTDGVARAVVAAVAAARPEVVLSAQGKALLAAKRLCPGLLRRRLAVLAGQLKGPQP